MILSTALIAAAAHRRSNQGGASLVYTLNNPNGFGTADADDFGFAVAISNLYTIVGAQQEDDAGGTSSGKAYIYDNTTGALLHTLDNPNAFGTSNSDVFGASVSISDSYAIVGASGEDDGSGFQSGKAYIFNPTTGTILHTLDNPNAFGTVANDRFGQVVAISESYAIVGAPQEDDAGGSSSGKAYIYNPATGALLWTLDNPSPGAFDRFGISASISDSRAIVGAVGENKAYIYNPSTGALVHTLDNPNTFPDSDSDNFGAGVAISDSYAIVGASFENDPSGSFSGIAYIFNVATGALLHTLDNPNNLDDFNGSDEFGSSVSITEDYAIVGAYREDDPTGNNSGKAYIFDPATGVLLYTLDNPNDEGSADGDQFGISVGVSNSKVVVGARYAQQDGDFSGKAYIYSIV
jgi:hypothetical protein